MSSKRKNIKRKKLIKKYIKKYAKKSIKKSIKKSAKKKYNAPRKGMKSRWSLKYKRSIDCRNPKGFSQKNYCARKKRGGKYKT